MPPSGPEDSASLGLRFDMCVDDPTTTAADVPGVSEEELRAIDAKIAERRRDKGFMDRLRRRHEALRPILKRLAG